LKVCTAPVKEKSKSVAAMKTPTLRSIMCKSFQDFSPGCVNSFGIRPKLSYIQFSGNFERFLKEDIKPAIKF